MNTAQREATLRVILVGRTGLDAALRLDPDLELIRVQSALEAVGEVGNPTAPERVVENDFATVGHVVVLGLDVDIAQQSNGDESGGNTLGHTNQRFRAREFVDALRAIDQDCRVLLARRSSLADEFDPVFDGTIALDQPAEELRRTIRLKRSVGGAKSVPVAPFASAGVPQPVSTPVQPEPSRPTNAPSPQSYPKDGLFVSTPVVVEPAPVVIAPSAADDGMYGAPSGWFIADQEADGSLVLSAPSGVQISQEPVGSVPQPAERETTPRLVQPQELLQPTTGAPSQHNESVVSSESVSAVPSSPADASSAPGSVGDGGSSRGGNGDSPLVNAVLRGQDVIGPALGLIRERLGGIDLVFVPSDAATPANLDGVMSAPVQFEGTELGMLHTPEGSTDRSALFDQGRWLAGWLRLADQTAQLRQAVFTDPLTGAFNRRYFDRFLAGALEMARLKRNHVTVLSFDIDNFKRYNDDYGHEAGDEVLREVVSLLNSVIRPSDRVCRIGGDEFVVVFNEPDGPRQEGSRHPTSVFELAQRFQKQIAEHRFPKLGKDAKGSLAISGGLATFPWDGMNAEDLLRKADLLALESKRAGKNAITLGQGAQSHAT